MAREVMKDMAKGPDLSGPLVTVKVGPSDAPKAFLIHERLLAQHSGFFRATFQGGDWKEKNEREVTLCESLEPFEIFHRFIYTGSVFICEESGKVSEGQEDQEYSRIQDCWELGGKYLSTSFTDAVTDALICKINAEHAYPVEMHEEFYETSHESSAARKLFVDLARWMWRDANALRPPSGEGDVEHDAASRERARAQAQFNYDLAVAFMGARRVYPVNTTVAPYELEDTCRYHDHVREGKPCYKTMF